MKTFGKVKSHLRSSWQQFLASLRRLARRVRDGLDPSIQVPTAK